MVITKQMSQEGWDVWEIEMTGGEDTTECDTCPDYTYQDLVDHYWPASIAGIMEYSGKNQIDYVGHSNGGRAALSSLNKYSDGKNNAGYYFDYNTGSYEYADLASSPVDNFVGVAVPSITNAESPFTNSVRFKGIFNDQSAGDYAISILNKTKLKHIRRFDYVSLIRLYEEKYRHSDYTSGTIWWFSLLDQGKISKNLMIMFNDEAMRIDSNLDLNSVNVNDLYLFNTEPNDLIVPIGDQSYIFNSTTTISENNKFGFNYSLPLIGSVWYHHAAIYDNKEVKRNIMEVLK